MWILALMLAQTPLDRPLKPDVLRTRIVPSEFRHLDGPELLWQRLAETLRSGGDEEMESALEAALERLAASQDENGAWSEAGGESEVATTARVLLAYSGAGYRTGSARYGGVIRRGIRRLLNRQQETGAWGDDFPETVLAAAALSETERRHEAWSLREPVERARAYLRQRKADDGGWGRVPWALRCDDDVTLWAVVALGSMTTFYGNPRPPTEHAGLAAANRGPVTWSRWLEKERARLVKPAATMSGLARQAGELASPYRFQLWGYRNPGLRAW